MRRLAVVLLLVSCRTPEPHEPPPPPVASVAPPRADPPMRTEDAAPPPAKPEKSKPPCDKVLASGKVKDKDVHVCARDEDGDDDRRTSVRLDDADGEPLLDDGTIMLFPAKRGPAHALFRDVTGDGVDDVLVQAPSYDQPCRYVIDGKDLANVNTALSFAAALGAPPDPWARVRNHASAIAKKDACAILKAAKKSVAAFEKVATEDAEIVSYHEPSRPYCLGHLPRRGVTKSRVAEMTPPDSCDDLDCAPDALFCRNHEPDPSADYYLFTRGNDGKLRLRAVALYGGS